ncbi:MAG: DUF1631 family protein [Betaproteobacteria bacterium]
MNAAASNVIAFPPGKTGQPVDLTTPAGLLRECRTRSVKALSESVSRALDTFVDELFELAEQSLDRENRDFYLTAKEQWPTVRPRLEERFRERLEEAFDRRATGDAEEAPDFSDVQTSWSELSLVADGDLDESVRFTDVAGRIRNGADEELAALDQRMAVLLDRPTMESHENPLSPLAICDAFRSALGVVEQGPKLRKLLIRYFDQGVRFPVPKLYAEINKLLKEHGVLPTIRYGRSKKPVPGAAPAGASGARSDSGQVLGSVTLPVVAGPSVAGGASMTMSLPAGVGLSMPGLGVAPAGGAGVSVDAAGLAGGQDPFAMLQQLMMGIAARGPSGGPGRAAFGGVAAGFGGGGQPGADGIQRPGNGSSMPSGSGDLGGRGLPGAGGGGAPGIGGGGGIPGLGMGLGGGMIGVGGGPGGGMHGVAGGGVGGSGGGMPGVAGGGGGGSAGGMTAGLSGTAGDVAGNGGGIPGIGGTVTGTRTGIAGAGGTVTPGNGGMPAASGGEATDLPTLDGLGGPGGMGGAGGGAFIGSLTRLQHGDYTTVGADIQAALASFDAGSVALPGGFPALAGPGAAAPARNMLHALKGTSLTSQMGQMDTVTLDIVAMLFDQIFGDPRIPAAMKALIGRLQIPMLKVAVLDKTFFAKKAHPARHMLDTLGELSMGLGEGFDAGSALYKRIDAILQKIVDEFVDDLGIFDHVTAELEVLIQDADKTAEHAGKKESRRIQDRERLEVARLFAQNEVKARVQKQALPRAVLRFLATEWLKLLIIAYAKGGRESRAWHSLVETMDIMVWSLSPKQTTAERQRLVSVLPGLLKRLTMGMDIVNTKKQTRERFNSVLMRCHAKAIGGGDAAHSDVESPSPAEHAATQRAQMDIAGDDRSAAAPGLGDAGGMIVEEVSIESPMVEAIELSEPESDEPVAIQMQSEMRPVAAPATLPAVTVKNPFGEGSIELEEVSFGDLPGVVATRGATGAVGLADTGGMTAITIPGDEPPLPTGDEWTELVLQFKEGDWIELHEEGASTVQARLSYVSPYRGTYVFTNRKGTKIGEFSMFDITSALRTGRMTVMVNVPLFDRAFSGLVGMLRKNAEDAPA